MARLRRLLTAGPVIYDLGDRLPRRYPAVAPHHHLGGVSKMNRKGFTLIELLIVVVIIGILAAIAIPKFANTKAKAYVASMKSDLRNLVTAEEAYFADSVKYSNTTSCTTPPTAGTVNFCVTTGNTLGAIGLAARSGGRRVGKKYTNRQAPQVTSANFLKTAAVAPAVSEGAPAWNEAAALGWHLTSGGGPTR